MLGRERLEHILHGVLGYDDVTVNPEAYERNLPFEEAVDVVRRLQGLAARRNVTVGVKCGNTLEVLNTGSFLKERVQTSPGSRFMRCTWRWCSAGARSSDAGLQISFSAGVDAHNVADCVAAGLVPVTVCTDLLRTGGYGRLARYITNLEARMRAVGARTIPEFIERTAGGQRDAVLRNTSALLDKALTNERYRAAQNLQAAPQARHASLALGLHLVPPSASPHVRTTRSSRVEVEPFVGEVPVIEVGRQRLARDRPPDLPGDEARRRSPSSPTRATPAATATCSARRTAVPTSRSPGSFGSLDAWRRAAPMTGFVLTREDGTFVLRRPDG